MSSPLATCIWQKVVVSTYRSSYAYKKRGATLASCLDTLAIRLINDRWAAGQAVSTQGVVVCRCIVLTARANTMYTISHPRKPPEGCCHGHLQDGVLARILRRGDDGNYDDDYQLAL